MAQALAIVALVLVCYAAGRIEQTAISRKETETWRVQCLRADERYAQAAARCHALTERLATMRREGFREAYDGEDRPNEVYAMNDEYDLDLMRKRREAQAME